MTTADNKTSSEKLRAIAERVAKLVRDIGIDDFRLAVNEVMVERNSVIENRTERRQARLDFLKKNGELKPVDQLSSGLPDDELPRKQFVHSGVVRGYIRWPKDFSDSVPETKRFALAKKRGFPGKKRAKGSTDYSFRLCCFAPIALHPDKDPEPTNLLPIPRRQLTRSEKLAILAAIYDCHWKGDEKVSPWGLSDDGAEPDFKLGDLPKSEVPLALGYISLFKEAKALNRVDVTNIENWLKLLEESVESENYAERSDDCRSVFWFGTQFTFTSTQAACINVLWQNYEKGTPTVGELTVLDQAGSTGSRLRDVFDKGNHPAWETMIQNSGKGAYKLAKPIKS